VAQSRSQLLKLNYLSFTNCGKFYSFSSGDYKKFIEDFILKTQSIKIKIEKVWEILKKYGLHFGYRTLNQICAFIYSGLKDPIVEKELKFKSAEQALDYAIYSKILPRLAGPEQVLKNPLIELLGELVDLVPTQASQSSQTPQSAQASQSTQAPNSEKIEKILQILQSSPLTSIPKVENDKFEINGNFFTTKYPLSVQKILEMLYKLETYNFASFI